MSAITAVANHLNIAETMISEIQEWASVLWVRFVSGRPRFVSKKAVKTMNISEQVNQINSELQRLGEGGIESLYGTYATVEVSEGVEYVRLHGYSSSDNGYLNGSETCKKLQAVSETELATVFPTWRRSIVVTNCWVWGACPKYISDLNRALSTQVQEFI